VTNQVTTLSSDSFSLQKMSSSNVIAPSDYFNHFLKFLENSAGRDKIVRLLQYGSRFLAWWLLNNNQPNLSKKFSNLEAHSSISRKVFRLLKSLSHLQAAAKSFNEEDDDIVRGTTVIQNLALAIWLYFDQFIWAAKIGLIQKDITTHTYRANVAWLIAMIAGIIKSLYLLRTTRELAHSTQKAELFRRRQIDYLLELLRNVFDLPIPLTGLSKKAADIIPTGVVGFCGTISSIIGIQQVWSKIK